MASLYDGKILFIFGGASKSRTLNDLYSLDFETVCELSIQQYHDETFSFPRCRLNIHSFYNLIKIFPQMAWSRIKVRGFHPSPRAGCCGVLCGTKWYITGGGSGKKRMFYHWNDAFYAVRFCVCDLVLLLVLPVSCFAINHFILLLHKFLIFPYTFHFSGHGETLIYDILKSEWSVAIASPPSSITTNKVSFLFFLSCLPIIHLLLALCC